MRSLRTVLCTDLCMTMPQSVACKKKQKKNVVHRTSCTAIESSSLYAIRFKTVYIYIHISILQTISITGFVTPDKKNAAVYMWHTCQLLQRKALEGLLFVIKG